MAYFSYFAKKISWRKEYYFTNSLFKKKIIDFFIKKIIKVCHNCVQYERVPKIFYFHILNIAKFGYIYTHGWSSLEQHHKIEKKEKKNIAMN
jgi:hypothetical protein